MSNGWKFINHLGFVSREEELMERLRMNLFDETNSLGTDATFIKPLNNEPLERLLNNPESYFHHGNCFYYGKPFGKDSTLIEILPHVMGTSRVRGGLIFRPQCWYTSELGFQQNFAVALYWYRRSADLGYVNAQYLLAEIYLHGYGVDKSPTEALRWFRKAAAGGHPLAKYRLAYVYDGDGQVRADKSKIVNLYQLEADKGKAEGQYELAMIYARGDWAQKNYTLAQHCFLRAATQEHGLACYELGLIYYEGLGVKKSLPKALKWFRKAVELRSLFAFFMIKKIESDSSEQETKNEDLRP
jgi:hypothetical protein